MVTHPEANATTRDGSGTEFDWAAVWGVLDGVGEQIGDDSNG